ncbi:RhoGEF domain-containing protein [Lactarius quietus]|nr:RhoGEF domain-containing protein [Lactarius quietus]
MHSPFRPHSQLQAYNNSEDASDWSLPYSPLSPSPSASHPIDSPAPIPQDTLPPLPSSLTRSSSGSDEIPYSESSPPRPFFQLPKSSPLPDPSQFPDPYPFRTPQYLSSGPPTLSSGGSSIASTRSSAAYTSSGSALASGDYGNHVQIASNDDDQAIGVGITSDDVVHLTNQDSSMSTSTSVSQSRAPIDQTRWSQSYSGSIRSRSSLVRSNSSSGHENSTSSLQQKPCDLSWQPVDERDEVELISDVDTEDTDLEVDDLAEVEREEERTSAIVIAEEGRGLIVRGDGMAVVNLIVQPGTTHLLIGSSRTAGAVPAFLTTVLPTISTTLLALDISANFLVALPPALESCVCLEELNVSFNPLRALPLFIAHLASLRVLIADSTGITTLPAPLSALDKLHTLSIRRNKMYSLPSWLCLLVSLQTLLVDGNPFQGPWNALMEPLLAKGSSGPPYPPSTPTLPPPKPIGRDTDSNTDTDADDIQLSQSDSRLQEDEDTITPVRAPVLERAATSPDPIGLNATAGSSRVVSEHSNGLRKAPDSVYLNDRELRRMKSAGELRQVPPPILASTPPVSPGRLTRSQYVASASASNLLADVEPLPERFATIGPRSQSRGQVSGPSTSPVQPQSAPGSSRVTSPLPQSAPMYDAEKPTTRQRSGSRKKDDRSKDQQPGKWGFLKKMSMGKLRPDTPSHRPSTAQAKLGMAPLAESTTTNSRSTPSEASRPNLISLIDVRLSSTGSLGLDIPGTTPEISVSPSINGPQEVDIKEISPSLPSSFLAPSPSLLSVASSSPNLSPLSPTTRVTKRRSFLPIGGPATPSSPLPSRDFPVYLPRRLSRYSVEKRKGHEKLIPARFDRHGLLERYERLISNAARTDDGPRSRRPTTTESGRVASDGTLSSLPASRSGSSDQLRSPESIAHLRSLNMSQTNSIATTDSGGSVNGEERKFKDDGGRRMKIVKEIVETERTYVRGLQELIDIYIKPAAAPVNLLGGVSSTKETVIPAAERRIVFSGVDSLFSFHKDIFLPALELAADSALRSLPQRSEEEAEGTLSANTARGIARTFVSHAAFMRMYSTYINNFDHSVQRIKQWLSDRSGTATSPSPQSPSLSTQASGAGAANTTSDPSALPLTSPPLTAELGGLSVIAGTKDTALPLLLEELARSTPPAEGYLDPLDQALDEISSLATNMNEGKRESESRSKLVQWQSRIRGKFPSPLVQPHRRLIMDGPLLLTRVVRKATISFEVIDSQGDASPIQVECLSPEQTPRSLLGILCNDLLVLCRDPSEGKDPLSPVDLWAVLRMQTLPQPASIVHGNVLRIVDNKAILYFEASSTSVALNWFRGLWFYVA